jgi:hypothetical protein
MMQNPFRIGDIVRVIITQRHHQLDSDITEEFIKRGK